MQTRIFIVRHAETVGNIEKRLTGRKDYELTEKGKKTAHILKQELEHVKFDGAYASQADRTAKTIQELANYNNLTIVRLEGLNEMYFGIYDGWKWEDVNEIDPSIKERQNEINEISGIDEQETMEQTAERMYECISDIAKNNFGKTILICSSGVAIEAFLRRILKIPFSEQRERFCQYNGAINEIEYENNDFIIKRLADVKYQDNDLEL